MLKAKTRWRVSEAPEDEVNTLCEATGVRSVIGRLLWQRGVRTKEAAEAFLHMEMMPWHDPLQMDGMTKAVERIRQAVSSQEPIAVYGDYDADGVTSTAVMLSVLRTLGAEVEYYIPDRFAEGYGPNLEAFRMLHDAGHSLIITVDNGISAKETIETIEAEGADVIVTDHHEPPPELPAAYAVLNPKKPGCPYPFKELAGVGVALKVAEALLERRPDEYFDLAALGTISDLVPLHEENRFLTKKGLEHLSRPGRFGVDALKEVCSIKGNVVTSENVAFGFGPRLNAAGRLASAAPAVELLLAEDAESARTLAKEIDSLNRERQALVQTMTEEAEAEVEALGDPSEHGAIVVAKEGWNPGVIGIVASRLVEKYYRPVIVLAIDHEKDEAKGSARSIDGFDMFQELSKNREILLHFGGHPMAAGLTMAPTDVEELRRRLHTQALESLSEDEFQPVIDIDLSVNLEEVGLHVIEEVEALAPFGMGNPKPLFYFNNVKVSTLKQIGSEKNHLKVHFTSDGRELEGVGFQLGELYYQVDQEAPVNVVGELGINEWNGFRKPQLFVKDMQVKDWQLFDYRNTKDIHALLDHLDPKETVPVLFDRQNFHLIQDEVWKERTELVQQQEDISALPKKAQLVFIDIPPSLEELKELLSTYEQELTRLYVIFRHEDARYFHTQPQREHFKWYYAFLKQQETFDVRAHAEALAQKKGWSKQTITFMTQVFFELGFVTMNHGKVTIASSPEAKDLTASATYQTEQNRYEVEAKLLYSPRASLRAFFDACIHGENEMKETLTHGL
ncbi:exonuclease RecJ [Salsuginibacillus halophilus]|uniref:Single-stranded-DNA-specific exonuclease RecJ n=1 Tax=Salsuginibacillus halophilus TaxID=517424 RepID=A0A2P8HFY7_9BACI|nr:single-stranded-DNA-specific exonuclease RecJ [Salsuginibacillus halophilus]PSL45110.1 exonuclease RecJ [Salsuginibacillus halophilus]